MNEERYEVVELVGKQRRRVASAPDGQGVGLALVTLSEEGTLTSDSVIGVLDTETHKWIVNPYARSK